MHEKRSCAGIGLTHRTIAGGNLEHQWGLEKQLCTVCTECAHHVAKQFTSHLEARKSIRAFADDPSIFLGVHGKMSENQKNPESLYAMSIVPTVVKRLNVERGPPCN